MSDYNASYQNVRIIEDGTNGQVKISTLARHGESRKTKLKNNFTGMLEAADSKLLLDLCKQMSQQLPIPTSGEVVVGMFKSGIVMAGYLALARNCSFTWSTPDKLGDYNQAIYYEEDHIKSKGHYLYGLKPGDKVILVEDEVTSGKGLVGLSEVLLRHDIEVLAIAGVIETVNFEGRAFIRDNTGIELVSLVRVELS